MRGQAAAVAAALLPWHAAAGGTPTCACLTEFPAAWARQWVVNGSCQLFRGPAYTGNPQQGDFCYAVNYGLSSCNAWDQGLEPLCSGANAPAWCADHWCYVNASTCSLGDATPTVREVPGLSAQELPHYSYLTCGFGNYFARYHRASLKTAAEIVDIVEGYVAQLRDYIERQVPVLNSDESGDCPDFVDSCSCTDCVPGLGTWQSAPGATEPGYRVDFRSMTVTHYDGATRSTKTAAERRAQCLSQLVQNRFKQIARLEYNDPSRMAFLQYGDQASAVYFSWPGTTFCPSSGNTYDPRFRPWYVSAVSGPKDVVIVMDRSGSMRRQNRWSLAREAAKKVLGTLTEHDYANVVLFSSSVKTFEDANGQATDVLQEVTQAKMEQMREWIDGEVPAGGTDFRVGFREAFNILSRSQSRGISSNCNQAILFLTDGQDSEGFVESELRSLNTDAVAIFTYSFGSEADTTLPKEIACQNHGIWYHVDDGADVGEVMSGYYMYYAGALAGAKQIRWTSYQELTTRNDLITGCLPAYDRTVEPAQLLGVVCMDVSTIISVPTFRSKPDFVAAEAEMLREASSCTTVNQADADLEVLRLAVSPESACRVASQASEAHASHMLQRLLLLLLLLQVAFG